MSLSRPSHARSAGHCGGSAGQALAEFALVLLVLMLLVMGMVDLSRAVFIQSALANAAREGARYAVVHPGADEAEVIERARAQIAGFEADAVAVTRSLAACEGAGSQCVRVTATYTFHPVTGLIALAVGSDSADIQLCGSSTMRMEAQ